MYSDKIVQLRLEQIEKALKIKISRTEIPRVEELRKHLESLLTEDNRLSRTLSAEEAKFIRDERLLSKLDFKYWYRRYGTIQIDGSAGGGVGGWGCWESQN